jgi:hypothetical protein
MWITLTVGRYRLDPALTSTDLQRFQAALEAARTTDDGRARLAALRQAVACYRDPLAATLLAPQNYPAAAAENPDDHEQFR